jgi:acylglycerol lipase
MLHLSLHMQISHKLIAQRNTPADTDGRKLYGADRRKLDGSGRNAVLPGVEHTEYPVYVRQQTVVLHAQEWRPENVKDEDVDALVLLLHGYSDSLQWAMFDYANSLAAKNLFVFGVDYAGHGRSDGMFVHIPSLQQIVDDCAEHLRRVKVRFPTKKVFISGHSMGGAVAILLAKHYPSLVDGALFCAPMVKIVTQMPALAIKGSCAMFMV